MKKSAVLAALTGVLFFVTPAFAHPPADVALSYDPSTKELTAIIFHDVRNPATHYINRVELERNGKVIESKEFEAQETNKTQTIVFDIFDAKPGDAVFVEAYCNLSGSLKRDIKLQ